MCGVRRQHISIWTTILHFFTRKLSHSINFLPLSNANNFYPLLPVIYPIEKCSTDAQRDTRSWTSWDQLRQILWMRAEQQYQEESSLVESWQVWAGDVLCCGHVDWDLVSGHHWSPLTPETWDLSSECGELATDHWQHWVKRVSQTRIILAATSLHHYGPESGPVLLLGNNKPILYRNYLKQKTELISKSLLARRLLLLVVEEFGIVMQDRVSVSPADKCFLRLPLLSE